MSVVTRQQAVTGSYQKLPQAYPFHRSFLHFYHLVAVEEAKSQFPTNPFRSTAVTSDTAEHKNIAALS